MEKLDEIKKKIESIQAKSAVAPEMKQFILLVLSVITTSKTEIENLSNENLQTIKDSIAYIEENYKSKVSLLDSKINTAKGQIDGKVNELKALIDKVKTIKGDRGNDGDRGEQGIAGKDGEDGSPDTGEQIVEKINLNSKLIKKEKIEGLADIERMAKENSTPITTSFINGKRAKNINFTNATVTHSGDTANVTTTGGGGSGTVETVVAGTGISVDSTDPANPIVTNSAPDQTVSITAGTNITSVTGTYPNFTINAATQAGGAGDVVGPASAVDSNFASFDTTTGKLIKDSGHKHSDYATALGADDNYVTDAQLVVITNTSGTNTGDNATNTQYSGLATSKQDALGFTAENVANKATSFGTVNDTLYPSVQAVKTYIDNAFAGFSPRTSCKAGTTANLNATYLAGVLTNAGALAALQIDGVNLSTSDRVLVKNQTTVANNGIYTVTTVGSGAVAWVLTRATDYDSSAEVFEGTYTVVEEGTANANTLWQMTTTGTITIGTTDIVFAELIVASQAHNNLTSIQGGTTNEYYHLTSAQNTVVGNTSGTNTGDQDLSTYVVGPASATAEAVAFFDGTTGKLLKNGSTTATPRFAQVGVNVAPSTASAYRATLNSTMNKGFYVNADTDTGRFPFGFYVTGDAQLRFTANAGGELGWGPGSVVTDTSLYRSGVAELTMNGTFKATTFVGALTGTASGNLVSGGALGTPSSGTLTNATGLPIAGLVASTSTAIGVGTIELGHASDTTISRASAGVAAIEGVNILTVAGGTMTGNIQLGENTSLDLDPAGSADGKYSGICITGTAGTALSFGQLCYLAVADSRWELADADAAATAEGVMLGFCVLAAAGDGSATKMLLQGTIRADAQFPALTIGAVAYVGETAGAIQVAIPTGADNIIRTVGFALTADELYVSISSDSAIVVA